MRFTPFSACSSRRPFHGLLRAVAHALLCACALLLSSATLANSSSEGRAPAAASSRQDLNALRELVKQYLLQQASGVPGQVVVNVGAIDPRLSLSSCVAPQVFLPPGSHAWGKTSAGVRCSAPAPWTIYVSAQVQVMGEYLVAAAPLAQGQVVQAADLARAQGDLGALPAGVLTDATQAVGHTVTRSVALGTPLRQDLLKGQQVVMQGQVVRLVGQGNGFRVSAEGRALSNGSEGQVVQARASNGQVVSGIARAGGMIEINW
jgi:flagellar basal body P-ring formation protein FlgA